MYDAFLGLNHRPFVAVANVEHYFAAATIENARKTLARSLDRGEGVGLLMGPAGAGKTLLLGMLAAQFQEKYSVAMLTSGRLSTRRALFQAILHDLRRPYRGMDEGELRLALCDHVMDAEKCPHGLLLLVDEAHTLSLRVLDEIRMLTNLARRGVALVRLILAGSLALEERFASPKLESFNQRIVARCYLEAFTRTETAAYIQSRIDAAGGAGETLFSAKACTSVFKATDGVPRLVNQVCDHAILLACSRAQKTIDAELIDESWADLQQLPTPWNENAAAGGESEGSIEFGSLDEESGLIVGPVQDIKEASPSAVFEFGSLDESEPALDDRALSFTDSRSASPEEQVEQIEQMISEAEEEGIQAGDVVRFAGPIETGPEVDLLFDEVDHPFQDAFEEEELVKDRYLGRKGPASHCGGVFDRMVPSTAVTAAPMALPPKPAAIPSAPQETATPRPTAEEAPAPAQLPADEDFAEDDHFEQSVSADRALHGEASQGEAAQGEAAHAILMPITQQAAPHDEDPGVLVIETDYDENAVEPTTYKLAPVRRQEYNQLFARLRRKSV